MKKSNKNIKFKSIINQIFEIRSIKNPFRKAFGAALCIAIPMFIAYFMGDISIGLLSSLGSFSYLYLANEPYAFRAKKIFFVAIGISLSVAIGTLVAPYNILIVMAIGLIGAVSMYIFGVLKTKGPTSMFFILTFLLSTGMDQDSTLFLKRGFLVLLSGILAWIIAMIGYLFEPHEPEIKALKELFIHLSKFSKITDEDNLTLEKHKTINALLNSEETIISGNRPWKKISLSNKFNLLNEEANKLYVEINKIHNLKDKKVSEEISEIIFEFSKSIESGNKVLFEIKDEFSDIYIILDRINNIIIKPLDGIIYENKNNSISLKNRMREELKKESIVFVNALRYGLVLAISAAIAFYFGFERAYWIPLSSAAVMSGTTIIATFNRGIQRTIGTLIGLVVVTIILLLKPSLLIIVIANILLTAITELFIVRNYALALIFITTNALLLAEMAKPITDVSHFITLRITNVVIGSLIGLIGTYLISKKSASSRLPKLIEKVLGSQNDLLEKLNIVNEIGLEEIQSIKEKKDVYFNNFKTTYLTAMGEIHSNMDYIEGLWIVFSALENINYMINYYYLNYKYLHISKEKIDQILRIYKRFNNQIRVNEFLKDKELKNIEEINKLFDEINILDNKLRKIIF